MFDIQIDDDTHTIRAHLEGLFTLDEVDRFNVGFLAAAEVAWRRFGVIRILADAVLTPVQPPDVAERFATPTQVLRGPDDRFAVLIASTLSKIQAARVLPDDRAGVFTDRAEAEAWITG